MLFLGNFIVFWEYFALEHSQVFFWCKFHPPTANIGNIWKNQISTKDQICIGEFSKNISLSYNQ